jgi:hypothetical protein
MLTHFAVGRPVIPSLRRSGRRELEDDRPIIGSPFQLFMRPVKSENLYVVSGKSGRH